MPELPTADLITHVLEDEGLLDFIPRLSPQHVRPSHMTALGDLAPRVLANIRGELAEPVRACISYPIRHYKTTTIMHLIIWVLLQEPSIRIILMCDKIKRAETISKDLRALAECTVVGPTKNWRGAAQWRNEWGGGVTIMSAATSSEGEDCHLLLVDDPIDEHSSRSTNDRDDADRAISYYTGRCMRKGKPGPVIIVMSRQHVFDPVGLRLMRLEESWRSQYLHQPAILDLGLPTERAWAPKVWPLDELKRWRRIDAEEDPSEYRFWSRLQGIPPASSSGRFEHEKRYQDLPAWRECRDVVGLSLIDPDTKNKDTASVWAGLVTARVWDHQIYITSSKRIVRDPAKIIHTLSQHRGSGIYLRIRNEIEKETAKVIVKSGIQISTLRSRVSTEWRARRTLRLWDEGRVVLPNEPWVESALARLRGWSGLDEDSQEIDALISAVEGGLRGQLVQDDVDNFAPRLLGRWTVPL